jgi:hypothetical protein
MKVKGIPDGFHTIQPYMAGWISTRLVPEPYLE